MNSIASVAFSVHGTRRYFMGLRDTHNCRPSMNRIDSEEWVNAVGVTLHRRHKRRKTQTDRHQKSKWVHFSFKL